MMWKFWLSRAEREKMDDEAKIAAGRRIADRLVGNLFPRINNTEDAETYTALKAKIDNASDWVFEDICREVRR